MEIHVSRAYQQVVVPKTDRLYLFARCPDCREMCYVVDADTTLVSRPEEETYPEEDVKPYDVMEIPEEDVAPLINLVTEYEKLLRRDESGALELETNISELSGQIFAPYLRWIQ